MGMFPTKSWGCWLCYTFEISVAYCAVILFLTSLIAISSWRKQNLLIYLGLTLWYLPSFYLSSISMKYLDWIWLGQSPGLWDSVKRSSWWQIEFKQTLCPLENFFKQIVILLNYFSLEKNKMWGCTSFVNLWSNDSHFLNWHC